MARKVTDGKAWNFTVPSESYDVHDGELIRVGGINGCIVNDVLQADTSRTRAGEIAHDFIHSIHVPSGVNPAAGTWLYWTTPGSFQYGPTHLRATPASTGDAPCFFVMEARSQDPDGNYVLRGRVLNGVTVGTT